MDIEVARPLHGWTERALSFVPGTVVQFLSSAGGTIRAKCEGDVWMVVHPNPGLPQPGLSVPALLRNLGDAPRLRVLAPA